MAEHNGRLAASPVLLAAENVTHSVGADVGEIHDHAQPIHLVDQLSTLGRNSIPVGRGLAERVLLDGGVGEYVPAVVSQGRVTDPPGVVVAQVGDRVADLMEPFDAQGRDELAALEGLHGRTAVYDAREILRVSSLKAQHHVDLLIGKLNS